MSLAGEAAVAPARLNPTALRQRFAQTLAWEPEISTETDDRLAAPFRRAAVLIPLVERPEGVTVLLTRRTDDIPSHFLLIPLDVRDANALAVLAMILCLTPGTAWGELSLDRSTPLLHVFDLKDEQGMIRMIKDRYEKPLMEIFES